jgi:hypothetical protein
MTLPDERYRALISGLDLLRDLASPQRTPRVPKEIRQRAVSVLRHYPSLYEFEMIATDSPTMLDTVPWSVKMYQQTKKEQHD